MGKVLMSGGGGSVDLDIITAGAEHILAGTVGLDKEGEPLEGSMPDNSGIDTNGTVPGINTSYPHLPTREGSALQFSTTTDGSNVIALCPPQGYYPGGGGSYVHRPASDFGNATASKVLSGNTFTSENGIKLEGNVSVQSILSFSAAPYSSNQITFTWKNPAQGAFSGVIIVGKTGSYPTSRSDGTQWYKGSGNNTNPNGTSAATINGFTSGTKYYFKAFSYALKNNADWIASTTYEATATPTKGTQPFTSSTTWTVPDGVRKIDIFCVGGGGGSNTGSRWDDKEVDDYKNLSYAAGGGGYTKTLKGYAVTPGQKFDVIIGTGGYGGKSNSMSQNVVTGGTTSFGSVLSAGGGCGGSGYVNNAAAGHGCCGSMSRPGNGGSGGGENNVIGKAGNGGSDGSAGGLASDNYDYKAATGQGYTTTAFEEGTGTPYAGGGGGGGDVPGEGGYSGGGRGCCCDNAVGYTVAVAGSANTGGGGGASGAYSGTTPGAKGGSGICIVRWGY